MKSFKHILGFFAILLVTFFFTSKANAHVDDLKEILRQIAPDEETATFYGVKPNFEDLDGFYLTGIAYTMIEDNDYDVYVSPTENEKYSVYISSVETDDEDNPLQSEEYEININFVEPTEDQIKTVKPYFDKLNTLDFMDLITYYKIEDLSLINYFLTSDKSDLWYPGSPARAFRFSNINEKLGNVNLTYRLVLGLGVDRANSMYESAAGELTLMNNGVAYGVKSEGIYLKMVLYIPQSTEDTKDAYIAAAKKRIDEYLGKNDIEITYGGVISEQAELEPDPTIDPDDTDGNFYNVKIGTVTYKFYIMKGTEEQLEFPAYKRIDIDSKVEVKTSDSSIPLDTSLKVIKVEDEAIKDKLGTEKYLAYDFKLHSDGINSNITQLENGKFLVSIPIPKEFEGKSLIVYYINSTDKVEKHEVTVKDGYATFETDHFSVYILAENTNEESNPLTVDNILIYISVLGLSIIGLVVIIMCIKKKK